MTAPQAVRDLPTTALVLLLVPPWALLVPLTFWAPWTLGLALVVFWTQWAALQCPLPQPEVNTQHAPTLTEAEIYEAVLRGDI
jgi:hypothetical protein